MNRVQSFFVILVSITVGCALSMIAYSTSENDRLYSTSFWLPYSLDTRLHANVEAAYFPLLFPDEAIALLQQNFVSSYSAKLPRVESVRQVVNSHLISVSIRATDRSSAQLVLKEVIDLISHASAEKAKLNTQQNTKGITVVDRQILDLKKDSSSFYRSEVLQNELIRLVKARSLLAESITSLPTSVTPIGVDLADNGYAIKSKRAYLEIGTAFGALSGLIIILGVSILKNRVVV